MSNAEEAEPVEWPIDNFIDLHSFRPQDVKDVVEEYLFACRERGILEVRIIHGKGIGNLRRTVRNFLAKNPAVESFSDAGAAYGGMGATICRLKPKEDEKN